MLDQLQNLHRPVRVMLPSSSRQLQRMLENLQMGQQQFAHSRTTVMQLLSQLGELIRSSRS